MRPLQERRRRSALETAANCLHKYAAEYLHDVDCSSEFTRRGHTYHAAKSAYVSALFAAKQTQDADLAANALAQANIDYPLPHAEWLDVQDIWHRWVPTFELPLDQFVATEGAIPGAFETVLRYDMLTLSNADTLRIWDTKTYFRIPTQEELEESFQTGFYLAAARKLFPQFQFYEMVYTFDRYAPKQSQVIVKTPSELDAIEERIKELHETIDIAEVSGVFPATGGKHCRTCHAICPLVDSPEREIARVRNRDDARAAAGMIMALRRAADLHADALRGYVDECGEVISGGQRWGHHEVERQSWNAADVLDTLQKLAVDLTTLPAGVLTLSKSALAPLLKSKRKWAFLVEPLRTIGKKDVSTEFGARSAGPSDDE